ncbi:hypothetical protein BO71DRAFT_436639 [Aspergillus ellipticus CBS 707.79]|uniref:Uncharacterized protein n=1 Tax=Aspergillus ellipticus CBS 707.79 TaxID=1448320 RepID=A0A319CQ85_9EURO|nr:hypothetical protein BO71DRAFT_436639 [Aspergillus ellipticus CBS 707.79]
MSYPLLGGTGLVNFDPHRRTVHAASLTAEDPDLGQQAVHCLKTPRANHRLTPSVPRRECHGRPVAAAGLDFHSGQRRERLSFDTNQQRRGRSLTDKRVSTDWPLDRIATPAFGRPPFAQHIANLAPLAVNDDVLHFNTQSSSQWDGLRHCGYQHQRAIPVSVLEQVATAQGTALQTGDILLVRTGWGRAFAQLSADEATALAKLLWLLAGWGMPIGEMFDLEPLSRECRARGRWSFFFSSVPL